MSRYSAILLALVLPAACTTPPDKTDDTSSSPLPEDTGSDSVPTGQAGLVTTFGQSDPLTTICDLDLSLQGSPVAEPCEGCALDLDIQAEASSDRSQEACQPSPLLTWLPSGAYTALRLAWAETTPLDVWGEVTNALLAGHALADVGFEAPGPSWQAVAFDDHPHGQAEWDETVLRWQYEEEVYTVAPSAYNICSWIHVSFAAQALEGEHQGSSTLDCAGEFMDVWSFVASGQTDLTIDTTAADSAADLMLLVNDAETHCTLAQADDNFSCSYAPANGACPSMRVDLEPGRSYHAVVMNNGSCTGETASYTLTIDSAQDPELQLVDDDFFVFMVDMRTRIQAWGELDVGELAPTASVQKTQPPHLAVEGLLDEDLRAPSLEL